MLAMQIAVDERNRCLILCHIHLDHRNGIEPCQLRRVRAPVAGYDLVTVTDPPNDQRRHYAVLPDALRQSVHLFIIDHLVRVPFKRLQITDPFFFQCFHIHISFFR